MCLPVLVHRPDLKIEEFVSNGFECAITRSDLAHRCGYLKLEPGHPWYGLGYDDFDPGVHGGLTFAESDIPCDKGGADDGWWIGFDCAHAGDAPDRSLPGFDARFSNYGEVRSTEYVREQLESLSLQALCASK